MPIFSCQNCGLAISIVDEDIDREVCCSGCKMAQLAPADVRRHVVGPKSPERPVVPDYGLAILTSYFLMVAGIVAPFAGWASVIVGVAIIALAQILLFARQIARQTYKEIT